MQVDYNNSPKEELDTLGTQEREVIDDLILQNKTLEALIKGLLEDIETFKKDGSSTSDIVRFTMQLNIMRDKKVRNLAAINKIIKVGIRLPSTKNHE